MSRATSARAVRLRHDMSVVAAMRLIVAECVHQLQDNVPGILAEGDIECVHQARVALRRLRSADIAFEKLPASASRKKLMREAQWLAGILGNLRDLQILIAKTLPPIVQANAATIDFSPLLAQLNQRAARSLAMLTRALHSKRYGALIEQLQNGAATDIEAPKTKLPKFVRRSLMRRWRCVDKLAIDWEQLDTTQRHTLRKRAKKLRYAIDFFSSLYAPKPVKKYLGQLEALQTVLGDLNDIAAAEALLQSALRNPQTATAASAALGWLRCAENHLHNSAATILARWEHRRPFWK